MIDTFHTFFIALICNYQVNVRDGVCVCVLHVWGTYLQYKGEIFCSIASF